MQLKLMSKPVENLVSPSSIRAIIESEDDFGHELRVGHVLRSVQGMRLEHGVPTQTR